MIIHIHGSIIPFRQRKVRFVDPDTNGSAGWDGDFVVCFLGDFLGRFGTVEEGVFGGIGAGLDTSFRIIVLGIYLGMERG